MKHKRNAFLFIFFSLIASALAGFTIYENAEDGFISYTVDPEKQDIQLYWKDDCGTILKSIKNLKTFVESKHATLVFAMNGGMYKQDNSPLGLYIENKKTLAHLNTKTGNGNFYLKPNGIFYLTSNKIAAVCKTEDFTDASNITFATQSGPMLVIDGLIHSSFIEGSTNLNFRNGVGILPNGKILFAMSTKEMNFYDFAAYFQKQGCKNALYLDGFVSRTYLPEKHWVQTDGNFGVMIGVIEKNK